MITVVISDDLTQIKRFKGRNKYELYIHNKNFREKLRESGFRCPDELLFFSVIPGKKIISGHINYLKMIQRLMAYISNNLDLLNLSGPRSRSLLRKAEAIRQRYDLEAESPRDQKDKMLKSLWMDFRSDSGF